MLFSIGHSNHPLDVFLGLLRRHEIQVLVDVRTQPYSKYTPHFDKRALEASVPQGGMKYLYLGQELGGRPSGEDLYDIEGRVLYSRVAQTPAFLAGIQRLEDGMKRYRVALLCSEEDPAGCHRHLLIGRVLAPRGIEVTHIRADGSVQTEAELEQADQTPENKLQMRLFELGEAQPWKSTRSVSPRRRPPSSSER